MLPALGADEEGNQRILEPQDGASENAVVALGLLESLVERDLDLGRAAPVRPRRRYARS